MRKMITFAITMFMVISILSGVGGVKANQNSKHLVETPKMPMDTLMVTTSPSVLTAGVVSELVDPTVPFTITVEDSQGNPVDLTMGGTVKDVDVWNNCFKDPHPETLPQYYWVRMDLHNDDASDICNKKLFPYITNPISIDFSQAKQGKYIFKGFVANDQGDFKVTVYTPDRRTMGSINIKVSSPMIDYAIYNTEDPEKRVFHTPGDPDFIMTAADNRIYNLTTTLQSADGKLIRGVAKNVSTCQSSNDARLTVSTTTLANFDFNKPTVVVDTDWVTGKNISYIADWGHRYWIYLGVDLNGDGKTDENSKEVFKIGGFDVWRWDGSRWQNTGYKTFYNTTCTMFDDGTFVPYYHFDYTDTETGWGMGCIYNQPYAGCFLFPDMNEDGKLNYADSLSLDSRGQTNFNLWANDVCGVTCLLGINPYGNYDVAGRAPADEKDPQDVRRRYKGDGTYWLDFDAFVAFTTASSSTTQGASIKAVVVVNPDNLEVGKPATCLITVTTQDTGKPIEKAKVTLEGAGVLLTDKTDTNGKVFFNFVPQKEGILKVSIDGGTYYGKEYKEIQVRKDLVPPVLSLDEAPLLTRFTLVRVSGKTEAGAMVKVNDKPAFVSDTGAWSVDLVLKEGENQVTVVATDGSGNTTTKTLTITVDSTPPTITYEKVENLINATSLTIKGKISEPGQVTVADKTMKTSGDFTLTIPVGFGPGKMAILATDEAGNQATENVSWINYHKKTITLMVGSKSMNVDGSQVTLDVEPFVASNNLMVPLRAISEALGANVVFDAKTRSIDINLDGKQVIMQVNVKEMIVSGEKVTLATAPVIKSGRTFVPFRAVAEAFGCEVKWASETKEVTIIRLWY